MKNFNDKELENKIKKEGSHLAPNLWNKIEEALPEKNILSPSQNKKKPYSIKITALVASILIIIGLSFLIKNYISTKETTMSSSKDMLTVDNNEVSKDMVFDSSPVAYDELIFGDVKPVSEILDNPIEAAPSTLCIAAFSESFIKDASIVFKGTIVNAYTKRYDYETYSDKFEANGRLFHFTNTIIHQIKVEEIYYNEENIKVGDIINVENICFNGCIFTPDPQYELKINGQYILSLYNAGDKIITGLDLEKYADGNVTRDGNFSIIYPFAPQIEVTADDNYLFHDGWQGLLNESTIDVTMNPSNNSDMSFYDDKMKLRRDDKFIDDLKALIKQYK